MGLTTSTKKLTAGAIAALAFAFTAVTLPASAGQEPTVQVTTDCRNDEGYIHVFIEGPSEETYDILVDDVLVGDAVDEGTHNYGPFADGTYNVVVLWFPDGEDELLNEDVVIDCVPDETTTTAAPTTSTTVLETTTTAAAEPPAPLPVTPNYTG
jgi:hypothetical protein